MQYGKNIELGDGISIIGDTGKAVFTGILTTENPERKTKSFKGFDFAFWLNKSKTIIQFNKASTSSAIQQLCSKVNISVRVSGMSSSITKIYKDKEISEILKDIIDLEEKETGKKFRMEMQGNTLVIEPWKEIQIKALYKLAQNLNTFNALQYMQEPSITRSIEDMKNSVVITSSEEKSMRVVAKAEDNANIQKFGLLQEVESIDDKDKGKASNIAQTKLKELNKVGEDISFTILGSDIITAGRVLVGTNTKYLIKDCEHVYANNNHLCNLTVEVV